MEAHSDGSQVFKHDGRTSGYGLTEEVGTGEFDSTVVGAGDEPAVFVQPPAHEVMVLVFVREMVLTVREVWIVVWLPFTRVAVTGHVVI